MYGEESRFRALQMCLREQPLQATDIWTACRVRYHSQLGVTKEEIRALLEGRLAPLPEIATSEEDLIFETVLVPHDTRSPKKPAGGEAVPSSTSTSAAGITEGLDAPTRLAVKEETPDWTDPAGEVAPQTPPLTPDFVETALGESAPVTPPLPSEGETVDVGLKHFRGPACKITNRARVFRVLVFNVCWV